MTNHIHCPECGRLRRRVAVRLNLITLESGRQVCRQCGWKSKVPKPKSRFPWKVAITVLGVGALFAMGLSLKKDYDFAQDTTALSSTVPNQFICSDEEKVKVAKYLDNPVRKFRSALKSPYPASIANRAYMASLGGKVSPEAVPTCGITSVIAFQTTTRLYAIALSPTGTETDRIDAENSAKLLSEFVRRVKKGLPTDVESVKQGLGVDE